MKTNIKCMIKIVSIWILRRFLTFLTCIGSWLDIVFDQSLKKNLWSRDLAVMWSWCRALFLNLRKRNSFRPSAKGRILRYNLLSSHWMEMNSTALDLGSIIITFTNSYQFEDTIGFKIFRRDFQGRKHREKNFFTFSSTWKILFLANFNHQPG